MTVAGGFDAERRTSIGSGRCSGHHRRAFWASARSAAGVVEATGGNLERDCRIRTERIFQQVGRARIARDYCRHRESSENISAVIDTFKPEWLKNGEGIKHYRALVRIRETETRAIAATMRALRLTNQSRFRADKRLGSGGPKPWEA